MKTLPLPSASFPRTLTAAAMLGLFVAAAPISNAAVLYTIASFDSADATTAGSTVNQYDSALVSIAVAPGLTGTTSLQLFTLQTLNPGAATGGGAVRFQNTDVDVAQTNGTLVTDVGAAGGTSYFQFGIDGGGGALTLENLVFSAKKATATTTAIRGYNISVSVNGAAYQSLAAANLLSDRTTASFDNVNLSLGGSQFQNINSVNFRVNSTGGGIEYATFSINGAVPEPSSLLICAIGGVGLLGIRRRR